MQMKKKIFVTVVSCLLIACNTTSNKNNSQLQLQMQALKNLADNGKISNAEKGRRELALVRQYERLDAYDEAYWANVIANYELYDKKRITLTKLNALNAEAEAVRSQRRTADQTLRTANCISTRQRIDKKDYSGLDSTSGVVAVGTLLSAVADGMELASKCDD